jgi:fused signal recognition particle receptor
MKKSYFYFIVPLVLTALFGTYYWHYSAGYEQRIAMAEKARKDELDRKRNEEAKQKEKAIQDAIALSDKRKKEKAERDAKEAQEAAEREQAIQRRNKAQQDARKFADQVKRLQKEVNENKEEITKIEQDKKDLLQEQGFLKEYVKQAEANTQALTGVLEKIDAADRARAEADRAAAAAKKASS